MSVDEEYKRLDDLLEKAGCSRATFLEKLLHDINFVVTHIEDNKGYYIIEQLLKRLYTMKIIEYTELVKVLGPKRAGEIANIMESTERFKQWLNESA